jgi:hypothetical protein
LEEPRSDITVGIGKLEVFIADCIRLSEIAPRSSPSSAEIRHIAEQAQLADHVKVRVINFLQSMGKVAQRKIPLVERAVVSTRYLADDMLCKWALKPDRQGLILLSEILEALVEEMGDAFDHDKVPKTEPISNFSQADKKLHQLIGPEDFRRLDNTAIRKRHYARLQNNLGGIGTESFRARLNRIRRFYGYPSSEEIRAAAKRSPQ